MTERLGEFQLLTTLYMSPPPPPPPLSVSKAPEPQRQAAVEKTSPTETPGKPVVAPPTTPLRAPEAPLGGAVSTILAISFGTLRGALNSGFSACTGSGLLGGRVPPPPPPPAPVRVGGNVKQPKVVHIEQPNYPPEARRARVEGVVILEATVTAEGTVDKVKVISGPPILTGAAVEALTHWKYEPPSSSCHPDGQNQLLAWRHSPVKSLSYVLGQNCNCHRGQPRHRPGHRAGARAHGSQGGVHLLGE